MIRMIGDRLPSWIYLGLVLATWQGITAAEWVPSYLLPSPLEIGRAIRDNWSEIWLATRATAGAILWGLGFSVIAGITMAIIFFSIPMRRKAILPFCIYFLTVPFFALAPLLVIWF